MKNWLIYEKMSKMEASCKSTCDGDGTAVQRFSAGRHVMYRLVVGTADGVDLVGAPAPVNRRLA